MLAGLLADEKLAAYVRCGLESIADPAAGDALRAASARLHGKLLIGVVNSIGVRGDAKAVGALTKIATDPSSGATAEALTALGRIATPEALQTLRRSIKAESAATRAAAADASLICAERQLALGQRGLAAAIYDFVRASDVPKPAQLAATARGNRAPRPCLLAEKLRSDDGAMFVAAIGASRLLPDHDVTQLLLGTLTTVRPARQVHVIVALEGAVTRPCSLPCRRPRPAVPRKSGWWRFAPWANWPIRRVCRCCSMPLRPPSRPWPRRHRSVWPDWEGRVSMPPSRLNWIGPTPRPGLPCLTLSRGEESWRPRLPREGGRRPAAGGPPGRDPRWGGLSASKSFRPWWPASWPQKPPTRSGSSRKCSQAALFENLRSRRVRGTVGGTAERRVRRERCHGDRMDRTGVGGTRSLGIVSADAHSTNAETQDAAMRALGNWPSVKAAPLLLDLAKNLDSDKLKSRALRGYIRLARQMDLSPDRRLAMCEEALRTARRDDEKKLVLAVLVRIPSTGRWRWRPRI